MCGIFGYVCTNSPTDLNELNIRFENAQRALYHRGPDDKGLETRELENGYLALGHTRLSIIDLSASGRQPMNSRDNRYTLVFNGEIYNYIELREELEAVGHVFQTDTDTEVLLLAWSQWGENCLPRMKGMFSFCLYDKDLQTLTMVRDAFGIKPLFYAVKNGEMAFASEISALLKLLPAKWTLNYQRAYDYLVHGAYDNNTDTFFDGIYHVDAGNILCFNIRSGCFENPKRWWWPSIEERTDLSFDDAVQQLREMFLNNVRLHLRSDVPIGAALSGGIDSSAVVCAMRHLEPDMPIHTFTFVAPGTSIDEEHWADIVNKHVAAVSHKVRVNPCELGRDIDDMVRAQGEPFGGTSIYAQYRVFRLARERGITVTLDGQGADELLAGYNGYPQGVIRSLIDKRKFFETAMFLKRWSAWPGRSAKLGLFMLGSALVPDCARGTVLSLIGRDSVPDWMHRDWFQTDNRSVASIPCGTRRSEDGYGRRLAEALRNSLTGKGLVQLLRHGDRDSMRYSVESRVPFLTTDIAEYLLSLPESYLCSPNGETKSVFRAAMRGIVPDEILDRRDKIGFQTPERDWLRGQEGLIREWLAKAHEIPFLDGTKCYQLVNESISGVRPFTQESWRLINYCRWAQLHDCRAS